MPDADFLDFDPPGPDSSYDPKLSPMSQPNTPLPPAEQWGGLGGTSLEGVSPLDPAGAKEQASGKQSNPFGVAAAGFSILGGLLKGMAAYQSGQFNAGVSRQNARLADASATDAILRGQFAAVSSRLQAGRLAGQQKTALASSGVQVNSGSALDLLNDTSMMSDFDAKMVANRAAREAWGYKTQADQFRQRASMEEAGGKAALGESILGGVDQGVGIGAKMLGWST